MLRVHPSFLDGSGEDPDRVPGDTNIATDGEMTDSMASILERGLHGLQRTLIHLGLRAVNFRFRRILAQFMGEGRVQYLHSDPRDSRQRICLKR